jgi:hypothetical protein
VKTRILLEKLTVAQLVKTSPIFMENKDSIKFTGVFPNGSHPQDT